MSKFKKLCQEAIDIQNASNLVGLSRRFAEVMIEVNELIGDMGTHAVNTTAIVQMWTTKMADLSGHPSWNQTVWSEAYEICRKTAEGDKYES